MKAEKATKTLEEQFASIEEKNEKSIKEVKDFLKSIKSTVESLIKKNNESMVEVFKMVQSHQKFLDEMQKSFDVVDETMGCILLAVRQNEYLQTWYPEQNGFPAMKACGLHPSKIKESKK